jgi:hypothetical protein
MTRSPEQWRLIVRVCGVIGLLLAASGYAVLQEGAPAYRTWAALAFYSGFAFVIAAIVLWYRHVPPRPPAREELEEMNNVDDPDRE